MGLLVLIVLGGVAAYVMKPDERLRVARAGLRLVENSWFAYQDDRAKPDEFREALRARTRWPLATWTILAAYALVFVSMGGVRGDAGALVRWGGAVAPQTTDGEWWRLFTASFVHAGFIALLVDAAGLTQLAVLVERMLGHAAFAVLYLSGAIIGTAIELTRHPLVVTVGPTGGILATYGLLLALVVRGTMRRSPMSVPLRALKRLAPAAALFLLHALVTGVLFQAAGMVPLGIGFVFGIVLARDAAERPARVNRSVAVGIATVVIAAGIAVPLRGIVDARPEVARMLAAEDRTSTEYTAAIQQFKLGALKSEPIAQMIERRIEPELDQIDARLKALGRVPPEQQPLVTAAGEYIKSRRESWQLRAKAFHKSNMRLLRDADEKERAALAALERVRQPA
ncbi:MAG TPA: rhomboid family intramembrane serine protease [Vicinamibacterales bacterium]|nr:rhomboid family intramembrane serine protease [Vicinamibacterales bacterium]